MREPAILRVARLTGVEYEWVQHEQLARLFGVPDGKIDAIRHDRTTGPLFTKIEERASAFTTAVVVDGDVDDETFAALADEISPRQVIELTLSIGYHMMLGRVMNVTRVDPEPAADVQVEDLEVE